MKTNLFAKNQWKAMFFVLLSTITFASAQALQHSSLTFRQPADGAHFQTYATILLEVEAVDPAGDIRRVEFHANGKLLGVSEHLTRDAVIPGRPRFHYYEWQAVPPASYKLVAKAVDTAGETVVSSPISIEVQPSNRQVVKVTAPDREATEVPPNSNAVDSATFEFIREGATERDLTIFYSIHGTAQNGVDYDTISNRVVIPAGHSKTRLNIYPLSDLLTVVEPMKTVGIRLEIPPFLAPNVAYEIDPKQREAAVVIYEHLPPKGGALDIAVPRAGFLYHSGEPIVILAALYADEPVSSVTFYSGDLKLGSASSLSSHNGGLYFVQFIWREAPIGNHTLTARAALTSGRQLISTRIPVQVGEAELPTVAIRYVPPQTDEPWPDADFVPGFLEITRTGSTATPLRVYVDVGGTATPGVDYHRLPSSFEIPAGKNLLHVRVIAIDDLEPERDETLIVKLIYPPDLAEPFHSPPYRIDPNRNQAVMVFLDNDGHPEVPTVSITAVRAETAEPSPTSRIAPGVFQLSRSGSGDKSLVVYLKYDGTATPGADYLRLPEKVEFPPGVTSQELLVQAVDDRLIEPSESVVAAIVPSSKDYQLHPQQSLARVVIHDNGLGEFAQLRMISPKQGEVFKAGTTITLEAEAVDPAAYISRLEFYANDKLIGVSEITFIRPPPPGTPINHAIEWERVPPGHYQLYARALDSRGNLVRSLSVSITVSQETMPVVSIVADPAETTEPEVHGSALPAKFIISRGLPGARPLAVHLSYGGTAKPGEDYESLPGMIVIPEHQARVELLVHPKADPLVEPDETVVASLLRIVTAFQEGAGGPVSDDYSIHPERGTATVVIKDQTTKVPVVSIRTLDPKATQFSPPATAIDTARFLVTRQQASQHDLPVFLSIHGTARNGKDYQEIPQKVVIPAGANSVEIIVVPIQESDVVMHTLHPLPLQITTVGLKLEPVGNTGEPAAYRVDPAAQMAGAVIYKDPSPGNIAVEIVIPGPEKLLHSDEVHILVAAVHPNEEIQKMEVYIDGINIGDPDISPLLQNQLGPTMSFGSFHWRSATEGHHLVQAKVVLASGVAIVSSQVPFFVHGGKNHPPVARIQHPHDGAVFVKGKPIEVLVVASDHDGRIVRLELSVGDKVLAKTDSSSLKFLWTDAPVGQHLLLARAWDDKGSQGISRVHILVRDTDAVAFVHRKLPPAYSPGTAFQVDLKAEPPKGVSAYAVEDYPPAGWNIGSITEGGAYDPVTGKVKFGPYFDLHARLLSYELTPPSSATGVHEFRGAASANGSTYPIGGDQRIQPATPYHPADRDSNQRIEIVELTAYAAAWKEGREWTSGPTPIPLSYVTRAGFLWKRGEAYLFDPKQGAAPACWIPKGPTDVQPHSFSGLLATRTVSPKGSSQSFEVSITVSPKGDASSYAVEERVPIGWAISGINANGTFDPATGCIRWGLFMDAETRTLQYVITPPGGVTTFAKLRGLLSVDGELREISAPADLLPSDGKIPVKLDSSFKPAEVGVRLLFQGAPGQIGVLEASDDLVQWYEISTLFLPDGTGEFVDTEAQQSGRKFYRLRLQ